MTLCGKPTRRNTACQLPQMPRYDGCRVHRTLSPDVVALDAARERMKYQRCLGLHATNPWIRDNEWWWDELAAVQRWASNFRPDARPACWDWDANERAVASIRADVIQDRAHRAPAGTSAAELARDLDWEVFILWHQHRCAFCGTVGELEVDHDHRTKLIRGLLCGACNQHEGIDHRNRSRKRVYHFNPPSYAAERYRTRNPATMLRLERNYSGKKIYPSWCQLAERVPIGAAPAGFEKKMSGLVFGGGEPVFSRENREAFREAEKVQREFEKSVRAMQELAGQLGCGLCRSCLGPEDIRAVEPVVNWVRSSFPGLHERVAKQALDVWSQQWGLRPPQLGLVGAAL